MEIQQRRWDADTGWSGPWHADDGVSLVFMFGAAGPLASDEHSDELRRAFPEASIVGCTTAGEIAGTTVGDDGLVATAVRTASTEVQAKAVPIGDDSGAAGRDLVAALPREGLRHVVAISEGIHVNGTSLVDGMQQVLPPGVAMTGGLAGDGDRFGETLVRCDDEVGPGQAVGIGFYGDALRVGYGSLGG